MNGKLTKNVSGKKTDVLDSQWIQKMHSLRLFKGSFIPDLFTEKLRQYCRHRQTLVDGCARYKNKMQKALRLMSNSAITEVTGLTGKAIITAILSGERDPQKLAALSHYRIKKSKQEIALVLTEDWRDEYIFELRHCYELYCYYQSKIVECDKEIQSIIKRQICENNFDLSEFQGNQKKLRRNDPDIGVQNLSYHLV